MHIKNNISVTTKSTRHLEQYVISKPHLKVSYIKLVQCVPEVSRLLIYTMLDATEQLWASALSLYSFDCMLSLIHGIFLSV